MARQKPQTSFLDGCATIIFVVFVVMLILAVVNG